MTDIDRLITAVKRVCDERLVVHRSNNFMTRASSNVWEENGGCLRHAPDCPGCELRAALEAVGVESTTKTDAS